MILVAACLLLVAVGLLAGGLAQGSATLQWGSFAASALAAVVLVAGEVRTRRDRGRAAAVPEPQEVAVPAAPVTAHPTRLHAAEHTVEHPAERAVEVPVEGPVERPVERSGPPTGAHAAVSLPATATDGEPPVEVVEVTDLLLVLDLTDEVLVVDEHPRYHLAGCPVLTGAATFPLPMVEARTDGFTPCGTCTPDHQLAERERARRGS